MDKLLRSLLTAAFLMCCWTLFRPPDAVPTSPGPDALPSNAGTDANVRNHGGQTAQGLASGSSNTNLPRKVSLGAFAVTIPREWTPFLASENEALTQSVKAQSKEIYQRYSGASNPSTISDFIAFHTPDSGTFVAIVFIIPPQADLMGELMKESPQKARWGIEHGFIRSASHVTPVARDGFHGFYLQMLSSSGSHDFVGGLQHSKRKSDVIEVMFNGVKQANARQLFQKVLASVSLDSKVANHSPK